MLTYSFQTIDAPGTTDTFIAGINNAGQLVGTYDVRGGSGEDFQFKYSHGTFTPISVTLPGGSGDARVDAINDRGTIAGSGSATVQGQESVEGFIRDARGHVTEIIVPGSASTDVAAINDRNVLVGEFAAGGFTHGFIDDHGAFTTVDVPGATLTELGAVNHQGQVAGTYTTTNDWHGFLYQAGKFTTFDVPDSVFMQVTGVNDQGVIVGYYQPNNGYGIDGFVDDHGAFTTVTAPGAALTTIKGINDLGQIVGTAAAPNEPTHGFVATPI